MVVTVETVLVLNTASGTVHEPNCPFLLGHLRNGPEYAENFRVVLPADAPVGGSSCAYCSS
jgi:hypothetical protein